MRLKHQFYKSKALVIALLFALVSTSLFGIIAHSEQTNMGTSNGTLLNDIVWRATVRLTWLGNSSHPDIMRSTDGNYNIVWQDNRNGNWDIYYLKVRPDGFKLVNDTRITDFGGNDSNPVLAVKGDHIYIVWQRFINNHWAIYFSRLLYSNKNIIIEIPPIPIRKVNTNCTEPRIAIDSKGYIHLVWQEWNNTHWEIMYDKINSYGTPIFSPIKVSQSYTNSIRPAIVVDKKDDVHIFWISYSTTPGYSVFYRKLDPNGSFLTVPRRISVVSPKTTVDSYYYNGSLYTVFSCSRERLAYEVIFTRLNSSGYTKVDDTNLTIADKIDSMYPHLAVIHDRMFVVWNDYPMGVIKFSIYDLDGNDIGKVLNISASKSFFPSISVSNETIGIVWQKKVGDKFYLYFRSAQFPDLKVMGLNLNAKGSNITVDSLIYSSISMNITYGIYLDGKLVVLNNTYVSGVEEIKNVINGTPGWHKVKIVLDPFNHIIETNENNNAMEGMVYVKHYSFKLYLEPLYYLPAGRWSNISVYITNTGNWVDNYTIKMNYNESLFKVNDSLRNVELDESESKVINFEIYTYRSTLVGNYTLNISVQSKATGREESKNLTVEVLPYVNFDIEYVPLYTVLPGKKLDIEFIVENTGNCNDTYYITLKEEKNWPILFDKEKINVSYHSSYYLNLSLLVPNGTYGYAKNYVNLTITSSTLNISRNASVMLLVQPVHKADVYVMSLVENGTYYYTTKIKVINLGNMNDLFNINLTGSASKFTYLSNASLILAPQESRVITIHTYFPPYMPAGAYKLKFSVEYGNTSLASVPIVFTVQESHQFIVNVYVISQGKHIKFEANIRNVGNTPELILVMPKLLEKVNATWILYYHGKNFTNVTTVYVKQGQQVNVTITLNTTLHKGMHKANIMFRSASHIAKNVTVEFRVGEKSMWDKIMDMTMGNLMYVAIVIAAIGGFMVYRMKFRR